MARRFAGFRNRLVRQGRKTFWFSGTSVESAITAANTAVVQTSLNAAALALRPFTIVRTRGYFHIISDQLSANERYEAAYGLIVVSDQAVAIGVTAVPTPSTDSQSGWFVYERGVDAHQFITGAGFQSHTGLFQTFDSKAMRKVEEGQDVISVAETGPNSQGVTVTAFSRILIKLH